MKLIVGLGNPGKKFENTRHNVGFMVVDRIAEIKKLRNWKLKGKIKSKIIKTCGLVLIKPNTFMNSSGLAVNKISQYLNISISQYLHDLIVVHDDLDIKLGEYKIQFGRGPKDHGGVNSIESHLKTKDFWRVRIGVENRKRPAFAPDTSTGKDYVLENFSKEEKEILDKTIKKVTEELWERLKGEGE